VAPVTVAAAIAAAGFGLGWLTSADRSTPPALAPFTSFPGNEVRPSFSPDAERIAFAWNGAAQENYQVYVKLVGPGNPVRLTNSASDDILPRWSPDGKWIAFLRKAGPQNFNVMLIPALGGLERKLGDSWGVNLLLTGLDWSPDGQWLVVSR
jgi:Tol biopolymer transport system component